MSSGQKDLRSRGTMQTSGLLPLTQPSKLEKTLEPLGDQWCVYGIEGLACRCLVYLPAVAMASICLAADAKLLHIGRDDASFRTFDASEFQNGMEVRQSRAATLGKLRLACCGVTADGAVAVIGSWDNYIYLYSLEHGRQIANYQAHQSAVSQLCIQRNVIVTASWDSTAVVWSFQKAPSGPKLSFCFELVGHEAAITCLALDPSGTWAATGGVDGALLVWNIDGKMTCDQGCLAASLEPHETLVSAVAWTEDASYLASAADDQTIRLYRILSTGIGGEADASFLCEITAGASPNNGRPSDNTSMRCLKFVGDNLLGGGDNGTLSAWRLERRRNDKDCRLVSIGDELQGETDNAFWNSEYHGKHTVMYLEVARDAETILTVAEDGSTCFWSLKN
eukprot:SAG31_NODE_274_length_18666_cov_72.753972_18_plen_394_part_00